MDTRSISQEYTEIAHDLIETEEILRDIRESSVQIIYLASEHAPKQNGKVVCGRCEKVPDKYKWAVPCDFTITVFQPNVERFTDEQIRILLLHELLHIGIEMDGNEEIYSIRPHDIEDFEEVISRYGTGWANDALREAEGTGTGYLDDDEEGE